MRLSKAPAALLLATDLVVGCATEEPPLPDDVYEEGWDETTRAQRIGLLRRDLDAQLSILRETAPGTQIHQDASDAAALALSALRSDMTATEDGKAEYQALESRVEILMGDAE